MSGNASAPLLALPSPPSISLTSRSSLSQMTRLNNFTPVSGSNPYGATDLFGCPFVLSATTKIYKAFWVNGASVGNNVSIGVYDENFLLLGQTASTGCSGASTPQVAALSATITLPPGLYYMGMAHNSTTTGRLFRYSASASVWKMMGCWRHATVTLGALPTTVTPTAYTSTLFPLFGLITRSAFDI